MTELLQPLVNVDLSKLSFMTTMLGTVLDVPDCRITRCGYTGEDGVEVSTISYVYIHTNKTNKKYNNLQTGSGIATANINNIISKNLMELDYSKQYCVCSAADLSARRQG